MASMTGLELIDAKEHQKAAGSSVVRTMTSGPGRRCQDGLARDNYLEQRFGDRSRRRPGRAMHDRHSDSERGSPVEDLREALSLQKSLFESGEQVDAETRAEAELVAGHSVPVRIVAWCRRGGS